MAGAASPCRSCCLRFTPASGKTTRTVTVQNVAPTVNPIDFGSLTAGEIAFLVLGFYAVKRAEYPEKTFVPRLHYASPSGAKLRIDYPAMPHLGIWTKPGAPFVCIEPWQGHADPVGPAGEITAKPGSILLAPGESRDFTMAVTLEFS